MLVVSDLGSLILGMLIKLLNTKHNNDDRSNIFDSLSSIYIFISTRTEIAFKCKHIRWSSYEISATDGIYTIMYELGILSENIFPFYELMFSMMIIIFNDNVLTAP